MPGYQFVFKINMSIHSSSLVEPNRMDDCVCVTIAKDGQLPLFLTAYLDLQPFAMIWRHDALADEAGWYVTKVGLISIPSLWANG